LARLNN